MGEIRSLLLLGHFPLLGTEKNPLLQSGTTKQYTQNKRRPQKSLQRQSGRFYHEKASAKLPRQISDCRQTAMEHSLLWMTIVTSQQAKRQVLHIHTHTHIQKERDGCTPDFYYHRLNWKWLKLAYQFLVGGLSISCTSRGKVTPASLHREWTVWLSSQLDAAATQRQPSLSRYKTVLVKSYILPLKSQYGQINRVSSACKRSLVYSFIKTEFTV